MTPESPSFTPLAPVPGSPASSSPAFCPSRCAPPLRASIIPLCVTKLLGNAAGGCRYDQSHRCVGPRQARAIDVAALDGCGACAFARGRGIGFRFAIERVAGCAGGLLGAELSSTAGHIRNGTPSVRALSDPLNVPSRPPSRA